MSRLHICNTFFEKELESPTPKSLIEWIRSSPIFMQLQFLPLLYAAPEDRILVSDLPENPDPRLCLIDNPPHNLPIEHWGPSLAIASWAKKHHISYSIPDWDLVKTVNSKVFSFSESPKLPGAKLLTTQEEIEEWIQTACRPHVLKTPFGTAGNGHFHFYTPKSEALFGGPELNVKQQYTNPKRDALLGTPNSNVKQQYNTPKSETVFGGPSLNVKRLYIVPMIGEPWVERVLDFSTQWQNGKLVGVTLFENESDGTYKRTYAGDVEKWALDEHLALAEPLIEKIDQMGYKGHIGIDAFIYGWKGKKRVHPIVEINARKTMSWVALQLPKQQLSYARSTTGLLPQRLGKKQFSRNILKFH